MNLITIQTYSDPHEANIAKSRLETEGIKCFIANESFISVNPLLQNAAGGYKLQCPESDAEKALEVLGEK